MNRSVEPTDTLRNYGVLIQVLMGLTYQSENESLEGSRLSVMSKDAG